jgi:uncharacterized membrane protein YfcA
MTLNMILSLLKNDMSYAILSVILAGFIRGFAGFGASMAMIPPLSIIFLPEQAIAIVTSIETIGTIQLLPSALKNADFKYFLPLLISSLITVPLGVLILVLISPKIITIMMASVVLIFVVSMIMGWKNTKGYDKLGIIITGGISGFLAGSTGMAGPPIILYMISPKAISAKKVRATLIIFFAITGILTLITILFFGGTRVDFILSPLLILTPFFLIATYCGTHVFKNYTGNKSYKDIALLLLSIISFVSILKMF